MLRYAGTVAILLTLVSTAPAAEYFVSPSGSDAGPGSVQQPFKTIQHAADVLQAGDTCTIRAGTYREWVKPPRGGDDETRRITYRAAPGEEVVLKGSERITTWVRHEKDLWKVELPDTLFGDFHPYKINLSGDWLHYGKEFHLGTVYLNGKAFRERTALSDLTASGMFFIEPKPASVALYANFGGVDPNQELAEVVVRECVFFPVVQGLKYITIDGLTVQHAAANWAAWRSFQRAALGTCWGYRWTIQNCTVSDVRCVGIACGNEASGENTGFDVKQVGGHIVRNNHILRCGEAGIHGFKGWAGSRIESNLIEDINTAREFGGEETGGIKIHSPIDVTIAGNVVRRVCARIAPGRNNDFVAIWVDWAGQGTRVTGNVVYDNEAWALYLQNNHGSPIVIDNNIFSGTVATSSEGTVFAHNLYADCRWRALKPYAMVSFWRPHTAEAVKVSQILYRNDRHLNNIYAIQGSDPVPQGPGVQVDWNVLYRGARKSTWGDSKSIVAPDFDPGVTFKSLPDGVEVSLRADRAPHDVACPRITRDFIGIFELTGQGLENPDGTPLTLSTDLLGKARDETHPMAGPFEDLHEGPHTFRIKAGPKRQ